MEIQPAATAFASRVQRPQQHSYAQHNFHVDATLLFAALYHQIMASHNDGTPSCNRLIRIANVYFSLFAIRKESNISH
jgi:hypothetical protein